jgi:endoglucanase
MKRRRMLAGLLAAAAAPVALTALGKFGWGAGELFADNSVAMGAYPAKYPQINHPGITLGAYDPHGDFKNYSGVRIEHVFMPWQDVELSALYTADSYALEHDRSLLITIEPWSWSEDSRLMPDQLKDRVLRGAYDETIKSIAKVISELKSPVTIRWGQEMEDTSGRFSWSGWKPEDYVAAYRRFCDLTHPIAMQAKFMWSPKGNSNLAEYYPGDGYADAIGLSVFGFQKYDNGNFGRDRTFSEVLKPGYDLVVAFGKPVVVAELGYDGTDGYVASWAKAVTKPNAEFPLLTAVVYFDDKESHPWPGNFGLPDWRVA